MCLKGNSPVTVVVSDMMNACQVVLTSSHLHVANTHEEFLSCSLVLTSSHLHVGNTHEEFLSCSLVLTSYH